MGPPGDGRAPRPVEEAVKRRMIYDVRSITYLAMVHRGLHGYGYGCGYCTCSACASSLPVSFGRRVS